MPPSKVTIWSTSWAPPSTGKVSWFGCSIRWSLCPTTTLDPASQCQSSRSKTHCNGFSSHHFPEISVVGVSTASYSEVQWLHLDSHLGQRISVAQQSRSLLAPFPARIVSSLTLWEPLSAGSPIVSPGGHSFPVSSSTDSSPEQKALDKYLLHKLWVSSASVPEVL